LCHCRAVAKALLARRTGLALLASRPPLKSLLVCTGSQPLEVGSMPLPATVGGVLAHIAVVAGIDAAFISRHCHFANSPQWCQTL
jgi:hypothetical protein